MNVVTDVQSVDQVVADRYAIYQGDSCELIKGIPDGSVHFGIHSPPFEGLYKFSNDERDLSNSEGADFWTHYRFLIAELYRVTMPGRVHAVHVMQLPTSKIRHGHIGMRDFRGEVIRAYCGDEVDDLNRAIGMVVAKIDELEKEGEVTGIGRLREMLHRWMQEREEAAEKAGRWILHSEICIWKDPVVAQQRTKSIRLLHKQVVKDSTLSGQGLADFIVAFRKPGDNPEPVSGCFRRYVGEGDGPDQAKFTTADDGRNWYSIEVWQRYASPVWMDIRQSNTLSYRAARDEKDEQHISPLQLDVIDRCIDLWSNPGDIVVTPFLGIGSEVWCALRSGRRGIGFELKPSYFAQARANCASAAEPPPQVDDIFGETQAEA